MRISFIGSGNVATYLASRLYGMGILVDCIYSRRLSQAKLLASKVQGIATNNLMDVPFSDVVIISIVDSEISSLIKKLSKAQKKHSLFIHTAGSLNLNIFAPDFINYGVLYPLQSFSFNNKIEPQNVPLFLEASNSDSLTLLKKIAYKISSNVYIMDSAGRMSLHLSAVFACNFVNHCYAIAEKILQKSGIPFDLLLPLIDETAQKMHRISPKQAQTGPAIRGDQNIISAHLKFLDDPILKKIYTIFTKEIQIYSVGDDTI